MSLLFGYASDLEVSKKTSTCMEICRIVDLPETGKQKYVDHEITKKMLTTTFVTGVLTLDFLNNHSESAKVVSITGYWVSCIRKSVEGCGRSRFVGEVGTKLQSTILVVCNGIKNHLIKG